MRTRKRGFLAVAGLAALALAASACSTTNTSGSGGNVSLNDGLQALNPGTGSPQRGGTLNMLGIGDVDEMDPNISYYTIGYLSLRMWARGLYAYPATPGKTTTPVPDLATAAPVISDGGLKYTVTIRTGAQFDTSPFTPVTGADEIIGLKRACNPAQPWGGLLAAGLAQGLPQLPDVVTDQHRRRRGRLTRPQHPGQGVGRHHLAGLQQQPCQQRPDPPARRCQLTLAAAHHHRPQQPELHRPRHGTPPRLRARHLCAYIGGTSARWRLPAPYTRML
jgi:hypothetical protein